MTRLLGKVYEEVCLAGLSRKTTMRAAVLLAACLSPILAFAQNDIWKGGTGKWSDSTKWSAGVPTSSQTGKCPQRHICPRQWPDYPYRRALYRRLQSDQRDADGRSVAGCECF